MVWAQIIGGPHGGVSPTPQVDGLVGQLLYPGDTLVLTGSGITPGTQVVVEPGFRVIGISNPTSSTTISITIPFDLPNVKHKLYLSNGNQSNSIDLFVLRDVNVTAAPNTVANVTLVEAN